MDPHLPIRAHEWSRKGGRHPHKYLWPKERVPYLTGRRGRRLLVESMSWSSSITLV